MLFEEPDDRFHDRVAAARRDDGVAWIVTERGDRPMNAFDAGTVEAMTEAVESVADADCVVLCGEGEFSVGADLRHVADRPAEERPETIDAIAAASNRFIRTVRGTEVPVVAAVAGTAAGGGLGFALSCDLLAVHEGATLDPAYARIALTPDNATPFFLARALGPYRARDLLLDPEPLSAAEAGDLGLATATYGGTEAEFYAAVQEYAASVAAYPRGVQQATKALVDSAYGESLSDHLERERAAIRRASEADAFEEGLAAFLEGRDPEWE